jgi:hypothetical protein
MVLDNVQVKYGKLYCYPSAKKIQGLLSQNYGVKKSIRQIFRCLKWLKEHEYLDSKRRVRKLPNNQWRQQSSLYVLLGKAHEFLGRVARWVKHRCHGFRMTCKPVHKFLRTGVSTDFADFEEKNPRPPPDDSYWETFKRNLDAFKAYLRAL